MKSALCVFHPASAQPGDSGMSQEIASELAPTSTMMPLCVDLDGTLVKSDTLHDSLLVLLRTHPLKALALPLQVLKGKAAFKSFITDSVALDVAHLPYNHKLLHYIQAEHARGREIYLATGADIRLAQRVASHLGIFAGVFGSDGAVNLTGKSKLDRLRGNMDAESFDYIGNATPDLPLLAHAKHPMVANPSKSLLLAMRAQGITPQQVFEERVQPIKGIFKAIRIHQWAKNVLIFVPLLLSHALTVSHISSAVLAFLCFCLTASATYIVNDLLDIEADRRHARKRKRPFAAGDLPVSYGIGISLLLLLMALTGGFALPRAFLGWLLLYLVTTLSYSAYLKRVPIVDVLVLSGLYTLRLLAGGAATQTMLSHWLSGFSIFLFLALAFVKRFAELENLRIQGASPKNGRGYLMTDIEQLRSFGTASSYAAVVIFAIYISGSDVTALYHKPGDLWLMVPLMILWLSRVWLLASRGELDEDPVVFAITDPMSLLMGVAIVLIAFAAL
jgi:4-hydroxybenzoate polyprenyltransferase/phosphoserine phosphatase